MNRIHFFLFFNALLVFSSCKTNRSLLLSNAEFQAVPDSSYSRAITSWKNHLYLGSSNGLIYRFNIRNGRSKQISTVPIPEIRAIHIGKKGILAMQSNDTSALLVLSKTQETKFNIDNQPRFWDGFDILPSGIGLLMGDPVDGYFSLYKTIDFGRNWTAIEPRISAITGEAGFAASGSTVHCINDSTYCFVTGGMKSRFFKTTNAGKTWSSVDLNYPSSAACGAFSLCFINAREGAVVGGDYTQPSISARSSFFTTDGGVTWQESVRPTFGYRSCVVSYNNKLFACGTTGIDISLDKGVTWNSWLRGNYIAMHIVDTWLFVTLPNGKLKAIELSN